MYMYVLCVFDGIAVVMLYHRKSKVLNILLSAYYTLLSVSQVVMEVALDLLTIH